MKTDPIDIQICEFTISDKLHPYYQVDLITNNNFYNRYIEEQNGGKLYGNSFYQYDFEINGNRIFLGNRKICSDVIINKNVAEIHFFGYHSSCAEKDFLEKNKGTKHMFLWLIICILKNFPNITRIELGDDSKIDCEGTKRLLAKYYFLKYGKQYYEYYFYFSPTFSSQYYQKKYLENIKIRKSLKISKKIIDDVFNNYHNKNNNLLNSFKEIFGEHTELPLKEFYKKIPKKIQYSYCSFFFYLTDEIFNKYFHNNLGQTYFIEIKNPKKIIKNIKKFIIEYLMKDEN